MNNPTELPDLDRVEAKAQRGDYITKAEQLSLIALARRAKPEGEAPQAEHRAVIEEAAQALESGAAHNRKAGRTVFAHAQQDRADRLRAALTAPAAQHAESGAPRYQVFSQDDGNWYDVPQGQYERANPKYRRILAAQSQGAQAPVPREFGSAIEDLHTVVNVIAERLDGDGRTAMARRLQNAAVDVDLTARAALAAKAEAPAAQQAAAPGALESIAHKTRPGQELDINSAIDLISEVHIDAKRAACSAPGTPEAPKGGA